MTSESSLRFEFLSITCRSTMLYPTCRNKPTLHVDIRRLYTTFYQITLFKRFCTVHGLVDLRRRGTGRRRERGKLGGRVGGGGEGGGARGGGGRRRRRRRGRILSCS